MLNLKGIKYTGGIAISRHHERQVSAAVLITQQIKNRKKTNILCGLLLILFLGLSTIFGGFHFFPTVSAENNNALVEVTIANNIDVVSQLDENTWCQLSTQKRLDTLQTVADIETYYLGLPHKLNVELGNLSETTRACYDDSTHVITINIDHFDCDAASEVLGSVCHEAFHAYQYRLCDAYDSVDEEYKNLLIFYEVQNYKQEFSNYVNGKDDAYDYYLQLCENDARSYARKSVADYYMKINTYLGRDKS